MYLVLVKEFVNDLLVLHAIFTNFILITFYTTSINLVFVKY